MPKFLALAMLALSCITSHVFAQNAYVENNVLYVECRPGVDETVVVSPGNTYTQTGNVERIIVDFVGVPPMSFNPNVGPIFGINIEGNTGADNIVLGVNRKGLSLFDAFNLFGIGLSGGDGEDYLDPGPDADGTVSLHGGDEGDHIVRYIGYRNGRPTFTPGAIDFDSREGDKYLYQLPKLR